MNRRIDALANVSLAGTAYFAVVIVALHFLRADLSPISQVTSAYAVGSFGFLMTSAFFVLALASWALASALHSGVSPSWPLRIGLAFLGLWGVGLVIAALFPIDLDDTAQTLSGTIHGINGPLAFLCLTASVLLVSWGLGRDDNWRPFHRTAQNLSLMVLAGFIVGALTIPTGSGFGGGAQRIQIAAFVAWYLVVGFRLRSLTGAGQLA